MTSSFRRYEVSLQADVLRAPKNVCVGGEDEVGSNEACTQISLLGCGVEAGSTPNRVKKKVSEVILTTLEINAIQIFYLVAAENESFRVIKRERRSRYVTLPWQHRILKKCSQKFTDHFNAI